MKIKRASVEWALEFIAASSDSDLFPPTPELQAVDHGRFIDALADSDLESLKFGSYRRFLVPKDEISYRQATQLDPQDALVLISLVHGWGDGIEARRLARTQVFSYRFAPSKAGLYAEESGWNHFWQAVAEGSLQSNQMVYCDIADFYNQIYHHTLENQLIAASFPNQVTKWIVGLFQSTTAGVSRGVPIGPHAVHILAEATLIPVDNALLAHGLKFVRYADDVVIFAANDAEARSALATVAQTLDKQQRLMLQRHKTKILDHASAGQLAERMREDQPISGEERDLLRIIKNYSKGDPYRTVWFDEIGADDWSSITPETLERVINSYLLPARVDYVRLGWFFRRLAQVGHPGALAVTLRRMRDLTPCLPSVIRYISAVQSIKPENWHKVGQQLVELLDSELVEGQEYYEALLLSLFARNSDLDHLARITRRYPKATPAGRRQILLTAAHNDAVDWLREFKEDFPSMDPGQQLAFLYGMTKFPSDERRYFQKRHKSSFTRPLVVAVTEIAHG